MSRKQKRTYWVCFALAGLAMAAVALTEARTMIASVPSAVTAPRVDSRESLPAQNLSPQIKN